MHNVFCGSIDGWTKIMVNCVKEGFGQMHEQNVGCVRILLFLTYFQCNYVCICVTHTFGNFQIKISGHKQRTTSNINSLSILTTLFEQNLLTVFDFGHKKAYASESMWPICYKTDFREYCLANRVWFIVLWKRIWTTRTLI